MATAKAQGSKVVTRVRSGKDGKGVSSVTEYYLASAFSSGVTTSTSGWTTSIQTIRKTKPYLWNYEKVVYSDGSSTTTTPVIIGHYGADGRGITSVKEYYLASASSSDVTTSTSGWTTSIQTITEAKPYLWNYEKVVYSDGSSTTTTPVIIGHYGADGRGITSVTEYYLASASSSDVTTSTSGWTTTPQAVTSTLRYLWHFTRTTYSSGTTTVDTTPHIISVFADTGLTYRYSKFVSGVEYRNDNNPYYRDANNIGYIDVVYSDEITIYSATNPPSAWICAKTNTGQALPVSGASNKYWTGMNSAKPIYTALVLANRIKAKYLDVGDLSANTAFITNLIAQSAFIEQLNTKNLKAKEITTENSGSGFLQMIGNVLQLFNSSGDERMKIHGGALSSISGSTITEPSSNQSAVNSELFTKSTSDGAEFVVTKDIFSRTTTEERVLKLPQVNCSAELTYSSSNPRGTDMHVMMMAEWLVDGTVRAFNQQILDAGPEHTTDTQTIVIYSQSINLAAGSHTVKLRLKMVPFNTSQMDDNDELWASISGKVTMNTIALATSIQKVEIASNGFRVALASNVYFSVYLSGTTNYIQMMNENYGLRITNTGIQKTTNGGSTWTSL